LSVSIVLDSSDQSLVLHKTSVEPNLSPRVTVVFNRNDALYYSDITMSLKGKKATMQHQGLWTIYEWKEIMPTYQDGRNPTWLYSGAAEQRNALRYVSSVYPVTQERMQKNASSN
jgi:hypothetical protein